MDEMTKRSLRTQAVDLVMAIHRSIDWRTVNPRGYWDRLTATMRIAATTSSSSSAMVERALSMMQIRSLSKGGSETVAVVLGTVGAWPDESQTEFLRLFREEPVVMVTLARVQIDREKKTRKS